VFTVQLALTLGLGASVAACAGLLEGAFDLEDGQGIVFTLAAAAVVIQAFQVIPVLQLERQLRFQRIGLLSVLEVLVFYVVSVTLAVTGSGARSVGIGLVTQASVGAVISFASSPWSLGLTRHLDGVWERLRFSLLYQGSNLVSLAKDSVTPVLVGLVSGAAAIGYVSWASALAIAALMAVAPLNRLYLPVFARLQDDRPRLSRAVQSSMRATNALTAPAAVLLLVLAGPVTDVVFGEQWRPGLPVFALLWAANLVVPSAQPLLSLLNAVGAAATTFRFSLLWMATTWLLTPPLLLWLGLRGFGVANLLVQLTNVLLLRRAAREADFSFLKAFLPAWTAAAAAGVVVLALRALLPPLDGTLLLVCAAVGGATYLLVSWPLQRHEVRYALAIARSS
jgi:PST family polysaccharide transporter